MKLVRRAVLSMLIMLAATAVHAQVQTGSIAGVATDTSNAVMPGVTVSLSGDKLIGGVQTQTTDAAGAASIAQRAHRTTRKPTLMLPRFRKGRIVRGFYRNAP